MYYLLFTSQNCKSCPAMKENVRSLNLGHFEFSVDTPEGAKLAQEFHIMSLPTLVATWNKEPVGELTRLVGIYKPDQIKDAITL